MPKSKQSEVSEISTALDSYQVVVVSLQILSFPVFPIATFFGISIQHSIKITVQRNFISVRSMSKVVISKIMWEYIGVK